MKTNKVGISRKNAYAYVLFGPLITVYRVYVSVKGFRVLVLNWGLRGSGVRALGSKNFGVF